MIEMDLLTAIVIFVNLFCIGLSIFSVIKIMKANDTLKDLQMEKMKDYHD